MYSTRFSFVTGMSRPPGTRSLTFIRTNRQHKQTQPREEVGGAYLHGSEHVVSDREVEREILLDVPVVVFQNHHVAVQLGVQEHQVVVVVELG